MLNELPNDSNNEFCNYKSFLQLDTINQFYI